ncbi:MFS general substrate transporter [Aspergillus uvarum CBS 121591]|uniref:MFS general substrate transporter n=1 Tax=Aspergillus uvarum CBS 121591 TaxID=1448315 RepID=A0A319C8I9_9EURO|nr:MFS general substrate transporter [Aspergillus uvarum CBS 121591]PYH80450.1 MFS general substrate transporter [Aspergillus uvarum CBS 121591]
MNPEREISISRAPEPTSDRGDSSPDIFSFQQEESPPLHAVPLALRWNESKTSIWRLTATFWCAFVMGSNDATYGAIIPYLEQYYQKTYTTISFVFLSPFVGYALSAIINNPIHQSLGRRGIAIIAPSCHSIAFVIISTHPPFPALVIAYIFVGIGSGLHNAAWNVWIGNMANSHEVLGFFHGFYGVGATTSPLLATTWITKAGWQWYSYYYLLTGEAIISLVYATSAFWNETEARYRLENASFPGRGRGAFSQIHFALKYKVTWICAAFLFLYGGIEVAIGGWIVVFMTTVRHGGAFESGLAETGFWLGITVGRFVLGFVSPRIGERLSIAIYILFAIALEIVFWLVPEFIVSALAVSLVGFFMGTIFPGAVIVTTRLLPRNLHVAAIGFAAAISMGGGAVFPFIIGITAQTKGVTVLQPILLAMLAVSLGIWSTLFRLPRLETSH